MGNKFASGKNAIGDCDVCGQTFKLKSLKELIVKTKMTGLLACPECWSPDQPQLLLGTFPISDPQAIRNPRPDGSLGDAGDYSSRDFQWGWAPVGGGFVMSGTPNNLVSTTSVGTVTITTT
jgi:hypothetical protein